MVYFIIITEITPFYLVNVIMEDNKFENSEYGGMCQTLLGLISWLCGLNLITKFEFPPFF